MTRQLDQLTTLEMSFHRPILSRLRDRRRSAAGIDGAAPEAASAGAYGARRSSGCLDPGAADGPFGGGEGTRVTGWRVGEVPAGPQGAAVRRAHLPSLPGGWRGVSDQRRPLDARAASSKATNWSAHANQGSMSPHELPVGPGAA